MKRLREEDVYNDVATTELRLFIDSKDILQYINYYYYYNRFSCIEKIGNLIQAKADPNIKNSDGLPLLHIACVLGSVEMVQSIIKHGVSRDVINSENETAFQFALRYFIKTQNNGYQKTPLEGMNSFREVLSELLSLVYDPIQTRAYIRCLRQIDLEDNETIDETNQTRAQLIELIKNKANPSPPLCKESCIPIRYAIKNGDEELFNLVISSPSCFVDHCDMNCLCLSHPDRNYRIEDAVYFEQPEMVKILRKHGADMKRGLLKAGELMNPKMINEFTRQGAELDGAVLGNITHLRGSGGAYYARPKNEKVVPALDECIRLGASEYLPLYLAWTYIDFYKTWEKFKSIKYSKDLSSQLKEFLYDGENIIHVALRLRNYKILKHIIDSLREDNQLAIMINQVSSKGLTPLRLAFNTRRLDNFRLLLNNDVYPFDDAPNILTAEGIKECHELEEGEEAVYISLYKLNQKFAVFFLFLADDSLGLPKDIRVHILKFYNQLPAPSLVEEI